MAELIERDTLLTLRRMGLTDYEAHAYRSLLLLGRADAATVARAAVIPPTRVHSVLAQLRLKGWARSEVGRPIAFTATSPRERMVSEWSTVKRAYDHAVSDLELAYEGRSMAASAPLWFIHDEAAIAKKSREAVAGARHHVTQTLPFILDSDERELFPALRAAARHGRIVRVILAPSALGRSTDRAFASLARAGVQLRVFPMPARITIADFERGLMTPPTVGGERRAVWIPVPEVLQLLRPSIESMWNQGEPFARRHGAR